MFDVLSVISQTDVLVNGEHKKEIREHSRDSHVSHERCMTHSWEAVRERE